MRFLLYYLYPSPMATGRPHRPLSTRRQQQSQSQSHPVACSPSSPSPLARTPSALRASSSSSTLSTVVKVTLTHLSFLLAAASFFLLLPCHLPLVTFVDAASLISLISPSIEMTWRNLSYNEGSSFSSYPALALWNSVASSEDGRKVYAASSNQASKGTRKGARRSGVGGVRQWIYLRAVLHPCKHDSTCFCIWVPYPYACTRVHMLAWAD